MVEPVTAAESTSLIASVIGGAGLSGVLIAVMGYLTAARQGRKGEPEKAAGSLGISALLADSDSVTKLSISLQQLALAADKIALITIETRQEAKETADRLFKLANAYIDEIRDLRRAVEDARK